MKKMITFMLGSVLLLTACTSNATVTLKEAVTIEYGSELKVEDLTEQEGLTLKEVKDYDAKKVGSQTVKIVFTNADGKEIEQEITLEVKDTKNPEITFKEEIVEITAGDEFDPKENIMSVTDIIDGDIAFSEDTETVKDGYVIAGDSGDYDIKAAGEYTITITAYDKNGNKSEKSYKLSVKEAEEQEAASASDTTSNSGFAGGTASANKANDGQVSSGGNSTNSNAGSSGSDNSSGGTAVAPNPAPAPTPTPQPEQPAVLCPNGFHKDKPCDSIIIGDGVPGNSGVWTPSEQEAIEASFWVNDRNSPWHAMQSYVLDTRYNDGRVMYTVVFY